MSKMLSRRTAIKVAGIAASATFGTAVAAPRIREAPSASSPLPDLKAILTSPLLNRERATAVMKAAGLQALVLSNPQNVYYATNRIPAVDRGESEGYGLAVIPLDLKSPVVYISSVFEFYYIISDYTLPRSVELIIVDPTLGGPGVGAYRGMFRDLKEVPLGEVETNRRLLTSSSTDRVVSQGEALRRALPRVKSGVIGVDNYQSAALIEEAIPLITSRPAEDVVRRIRLVKSPAEIALMKVAAQANVESALEAGRTIRQSGSIRRLRERFYAEAAKRGNTGVFMVADGVLAESVDHPLIDGQALLIDCVSQCGGYHGDFARTVFMGEPQKPMLNATQAIGAGWDSVREILKPGVTFSQIHAHGVESMKKLGYDYTVAFGPHSVGLVHSDQPRRALDGSIEDIVLEKNMIISVDCPLMDTGLGGTAHLEDLTLITESGAVAIHATGDRVIVV